MSAGDWTWLEVAKLVGSLLTPAIIAALGIYIHRVTKRFEHVQWKNQKLTEKRLAIYDELGPLLNDILCYFTFVGGWRDLDPPDVIALKRTIDKKIYHAAPLFSPEFFSACMDFQNLCFETFGGWGRDASLRTRFDRRKQARSDWSEKWSSCFSTSASDPKDVRSAYHRIMEVFSREIGVYPDQAPPQTGRMPSNIL